MSSDTAVATQTALPQGTWQVDPVHSSANFAVKHMAVSTFRGRFEHVDGSLTVADDGSARLVGDVRADSIVVKDETLQAHLSAPDFFDVERYPEVRFESTSIRRQGDDLVIDGDLTIKGETHRVAARGTISGPADVGQATKLGLSLETVIDRSEYGLNFNMELPSGGVAVANQVTLTVELELALAEA